MIQFNLRAMILGCGWNCAVNLSSDLLRPCRCVIPSALCILWVFQREIDLYNIIVLNDVRGFCVTKSQSRHDINDLMKCLN